MLKGYRDSGFEKCMNEIISRNGQSKKIRMPNWLKKCSTIKEIIETLQKKDIWPIVEILYKSNSDYLLYIGPIISISDQNFTIYHYDATGKWEDDYIINFNEIFKISINDKYSFQFNRYMREKIKAT